MALSAAGLAWRQRACALARVHQLSGPRVKVSLLTIQVFLLDVGPSLLPVGNRLSEIEDRLILDQVLLRLVSPMLLLVPLRLHCSCFPFA